MTNISLHPAFDLLDTHHIAALDITVLHCQHKDTKAHHYHLACQNSENAFMIGFATQPMTSRGEAHILEHTVLCGSEKYPVRDPFFSMIKRSLNTYMNAMTAADWTVYPFATQNKKDFFNLLSVYTDAVFFPNIHELDFAQEGIRIELNDNDEAEYHGIVFNEMKGAMSGEIDQLYYALTPHLFPTTTYHYNSGGNPQEIPKLTHKQLVEFHQSHYHPSNAIIMSFGDIDIKEIQACLHDDALVRFDDVHRPKLGKKYSSMKEKRFLAPIAVTDTYTADNDDGKSSHQVLAWLLPAITDPKQRLALRLMEGVLIEHAGSPLRAYLDSHPLGTATSPLLGLDDSHYEMVFYAGLRGCRPQDAKQIETGILQLLTQIATTPINSDTIETVLHQIELDQRHIGGDGMPYGLTLMLEGFSTAIHGGNPVDIWHIDEHLSWLRQMATTPNWLQQLIQTHLIDNPHRVRLTLSADTTKAKQLADAEKAELLTLTQSLSQAEKQAIRQHMHALKERQEMIDDVSLLPKVGLTDINKDINMAQALTSTLTIGTHALPLHEYHAGTNGLYYYQVIMDLQQDIDILHNPILPIYLYLLSELGTDTYDARQFQAVQAAHSSGVTARISQRTDMTDKDTMSSYFVVATRALSSKTQAISLVNDVINRSVFDETQRIQELLQQKYTSWQSRLSRQGHAYAMQTATATMSHLGCIEYAYSGLPALVALKQFLSQSEATPHLWQTLTDRLRVLHQKIIASPKQILLICEADVANTLKHAICQNLTLDLPNFECQKSDDLPFDKLTPLLQEKATDTAWLISTNVYHNAVAYPATTSDHPDTPALMVLASFLRNGYLHSAIREKGGAYGGGASFDSNGAAFRFYSYRDPNCQQTFEHFYKSIDWLLDNDHHQDQLEEAILGIIAGMDKPNSPAGEAVKACFSNLHGRDKTWQQSLKENLLLVSIDDLKRVATTYLKDKPCVRATIAPIEQLATVQELGFVTHTLTI